MSCCYVATAHKPTIVTHSLVGSITGPKVLNLVVSRSTRIEIYVLEPSGLRLLHDVPLCGRVATMALWHPSGKPTDQLFISTERYQFCILSYDASKGQLVTEAKGDVVDRVGCALQWAQYPWLLLISTFLALRCVLARAAALLTRARSL